MHDNAIMIQNENPGFSTGGVDIYCNDSGGRISVSGSSYVTIAGNGTVNAVAYNYHSLERLKKNIVKCNIKALNLINDSEIYTYNFKHEDDTHKKHIGFVIGKNYKTPKEVITDTNDGISSYDMCSILWKAIQEQQEEIELLKEEIKLLKGGK